MNKNVKIITIAAFAFFAFLCNSYAHSVIGIDFETVRSFEGLNIRTGRNIQFAPHDYRTVKITGENKWAYKIRVFDRGIDRGEEYFVAKKWARRALNIQAAMHAAQMNDSLRNAGRVPEPDCCDSNVYDDPSKPVTIFEEVRPVPRPTNLQVQGNWKAGCGVLSNERALSSTHHESLERCILSIQHAITQGARNRNGSLNRSAVFRNLYKKLNPAEQRFAAMVFTAQGEAQVITRGRPPQIQEMSSVMKVVENRKRASNDRGGNFNELDVALDPMQFSMYNANDPSWKRVLDPGRSDSYANAVAAYVQFVKADFQPKPDIDRVYHYHANYVMPNWEERSKQITPLVNGVATRSAPAGYNERSPAGRRQIAKSFSRVRHIFYKDIAWSRRPRTPWR